MRTQIVQTLMIAVVLAAAQQAFAQDVERTAGDVAANGQQPPQIGEAAARALNDAIELMNAGEYEQAKAAVIALDQRALNPGEIARVEQVLADIASKQSGP